MFIVSAYEGSVIQADDRRFTVGDVLAPGKVQVHVEGEAEPVTVSWDRQLELFPGVHVTVERALGFSSKVRFRFNAPREVHIRSVSHDPGPDQGIEGGGPASPRLRAVRGH